MLAYPFAEPYWLRVEERTLYAPDLPAEFDGLRVAFLSDLHVGPYYSAARLEALLAQVQAWRPDLMLLGGDYADDSEGAVRFFSSRPGFSAPLGVYAVPGNHDRMMPESNFARLGEAMRAAGVMPLFNAVYPVRRGEAYLYLAGVDDYANGHPDVAGVAMLTRAADFTLLLMHNPDGIPSALAARDRDGDAGWVDLILCGHTHGGQITLFGQRALLPTNTPETGERYRTGWQREGNVDILTSNGVGTSVLPIRFFARPEVHLLTLRRVGS